jgi:hypothetical protein
LHILDVVNNYTSFELTASLRPWKPRVVLPPPLLPAIVFDNSLKQAQFTTVFYQIKEVDWVGFEPTTSAIAAAYHFANSYTEHDY